MALIFDANAMTVLNGLRATLQADSALAPLAAILPHEVKDAFAPPTLPTLCDRIAQKNPRLGVRLLGSAVKAMRSEGWRDMNEAWKDFTATLAEEPSEETRKTKPLVSFDVLKKVLMTLNGDQSREWLRESLKALKIPDPDSILNADLIRLPERTKILLRIGRGDKPHFMIYSPHDLDDAGQMTLNIETPGNWKKPLDEKTLQLLIGRSLAIIILRHFTADIIARPHQKVLPADLAKPIGLMVIHRNGATQLSPPLLPKKVDQDWSDILKWMTDGAILLAAHKNAQHSRVRAQTEAHLMPGGSRVDLQNFIPLWLELLPVKNVVEILTKTAGSIIPSHPAHFKIVLELESKKEKNKIGVSLADERGASLLVLTMDPQTLKTLQPDDIIEIIWESLSASQASLGERNKRERRADKGFDLDLNDIRSGHETTEEEKRGAALFKLLFGFYRFSQSKPNENTEIFGLGKPAQQIFFSALAAMGKMSPGSPPIGAKKWFVREAATESTGNIAEIIPIAGKKSILIHLHGRIEDLSKQDWMFLFKTLQSRFPNAFKVSLASHEVIVG